MMETVPTELYLVKACSPTDGTYLPILSAEPEGRLWCRVMREIRRTLQINRVIARNSPGAPRESQVGDQALSRAPFQKVATRNQ